MTPQEKAKELVDKFSIDIRPFSENGEWSKGQAKQCALIAVDLLIKHCPSDNGNPPNLQTHEGNSEYWQQVRTEIEKL